MSRSAKTVNAKIRNWAHTTKVVTRLQANDLISPVVCVGLDWEGHGLVQLAVRRTQQDFPVSLPRVLPDESVVLKVTKAQRTDKFVRNAPYKASFELHGTNMSSKYEVPPKCSAFVNRCGGCTFQHLDYGKQVAEKQRLLDELFPDTKVGNVIPSPTWAYRSRMEFNFLRSPDTGLPVLSMQRHRSIIPLTVSACPVLPPKAEACAKALAGALEPYGTLLQAYDARTARGVLHRAVFKTAEAGAGAFDQDGKWVGADEKVLLHVRVTELTPEVQDAVCRAAHSVGVDRVCVEDMSGAATATDGPSLEHGDDASPHCVISDISGDATAALFHHVRWTAGRNEDNKSTTNTSIFKCMLTKLVVAPRVFFQPNLRLLPRMIELVTSLIARVVPRGAVVWDLFSGAGTISIPLAQLGFDVHCADSSLRGLNENVEANGGGPRCGIGNDTLPFVVTQEDGDVEKDSDARVPLKVRGWEVDLSVRLDLTPMRDAPRPEAIVVDPPRDGCPIKLRRWLKSSDVPYIIYVSCNPLTMARDMKYLAEGGGYQIEHLVPLDFYPHVSHVEMIACLVKDKNFVPKTKELDKEKDEE